MREHEGIIAEDGVTHLGWMVSRSILGSSIPPFLPFFPSFPFFCSGEINPFE